MSSRICSTAGHISAAIANHLPGPGAIYVSQTLAFKRPVRLGDEVETVLELTALNPDKAFATFSTVCSVNGKTVLEGEAVVMVPSRGSR